MVIKHDYVLLFCFQIIQLIIQKSSLFRKKHFVITRALSTRRNSVKFVALALQLLLFLSPEKVTTNAEYLRMGVSRLSCLFFSLHCARTIGIEYLTGHGFKCVGIRFASHCKIWRIMIAEPTPTCQLMISQYNTFCRN